jgi:hypothetical protein
MRSTMASPRPEPPLPLRDASSRVKGWPTGEAWINSTTLLSRKQVLERLFRAQEMSNGEKFAVHRLDDMPNDEKRFMKEAGQALSFFKLDVNQWYVGLPGSKAQKQRYMNKLLLAMAPTQPSGDEGMPIDSVRALVLDPAYQLK